MKLRAIAAAVLVVVLSSCATSTSTSTTLPAPNPGSPSPTVTTPPPAVTTSPPADTTPAPADTTGPTHAPVWLTVKYRSDPVDIADARFAFLDGGSSSLVDAAFYDAGNDYMIVSLDGTAYHYCDMPSSVWSAFTVASSLGSFYRSRIKGNFDCRTGFVPQY